MAAAPSAHAGGSSSSVGVPAPDASMEDDEVAGSVWASLDPRSAELQLYPLAVASRLEAAYRAIGTGRRRPVSLQGLGGIFEDACVEMGGDEPPVQRTARGRRDVRRLEVLEGSCEVSVFVVPSRTTWRIAEFSVPGVTEERSAKIDATQLLAQEVQDAASSSDRRAATERGDADGLVALWEWCRVPKAKDPQQLPRDAWGIYGEEHGKTIEAAFREGKPSAPICIGIRTYDVVFTGTETGKQVDRALNKRRLVRRRLLPPGERDEVLRAASEEFAANNADVAEGECAVCFADFAETPTIPVVRLAECGHCFHGACVQEVADKNDPCPLCRTDVNWRAALGALAGLHAGDR